MAARPWQGGQNCSGPEKLDRRPGPRSSSNTVPGRCGFDSPPNRTPGPSRFGGRGGGRPLYAIRRRSTVIAAYAHAAGNFRMYRERCNAGVAARTAAREASPRGQAFRYSSITPSSYPGTNTAGYFTADDYAVSGVVDQPIAVVIAQLAQTHSLAIGLLTDLVFVGVASMAQLLCFSARSASRWSRRAWSRCRWSSSR